MRKLNKNIWIAKPWIMGLFILLPVASVGLYAAWTLIDHKPALNIIPVALTALIFCSSGIMLLIYINRIPVFIRQLVMEKSAAVQKSETRNRAIVAALPDMIFIIDRDGRYLDFTKPAQFPTAVDPDQFILKKITDILQGPLAAEAMSHIEKVFSTGEMQSHHYQMEIGNEIRSFESRYVLHSENEVMVLVRDTTNVKIAEQRFRENEDKYKMLVEQATDSIFIADFQGHFLVVNPAGCKMSQYSEDELLKMRFHDLAVPDELKVMPFQLAEIASGKTVTSERKMRRKDGEMIDVEIAARIIAPNRFLAFVRDISERKKAESELVKSRESLRQLTNYIENIREEERWHTAKEIHDQLGQQLAVLKMDLSKLGKKITASDEDLGPDLNNLLGTINSMIGTVRKIASDLRPGILDDIGLIATLDWYCKDFTKKTGIKTTFISDITDDKVPKKLGITVFRIFQDSLSNVARHSKANKTDVSLLHRNNRLIVLIEDNGNGFDPAIIEQDKAPGIQAMKERASMVKGAYNINSTPGRGTIIELTIPLEQS